MKTVTSVRAIPHLRGYRIDLTWQNPPASDFDGDLPLLGIRIVRRERTFPLSQDDGEIVYRETQPLIAQFADDGLKPLTTYYYTIFAVDSAVSPNYYADDNSRAAAFATANYNLAERLYKQLPAVHQRYDALGAKELIQQDPALASALGALPPNLRGRGQLWRFFYAAAAPMDLMRSFAEGLRLLHNVDLTRPEFLLLLAQWLGWELDRTLPIFAQRNEIKFAPSLYRSVGTIPNLRSIVTRYTGWYTQVSEFAYSVARTNTPSQLNIFAIVETNGKWLGTDDAALVLGFGADNNKASLTHNIPATLVSEKKEPFALRPGMELSITADNRLPVAVRFQPGDFEDISRAAASEVAAVLNRTLSEVTTTARQDGSIVLSSHSAGPESSLQIDAYPASMVTLEGAPCGRLGTFVDKATRVRLFYETADPSTPLTTSAAAQSLSREGFSSRLLSTGTQQPPTSGATVIPSLSQSRVRYKTYRNGSWGASYPLPVESTLAQGDPAAVELLDGRIWVAWIDNPNVDSSLTNPPQKNVRFMLGTVRTPQPAQLKGQRRELFNITPGTRLFRLKHVHASVQPNRTLLLATFDVGGDARLEIDLPSSSAARSLGFDTGNAVAIGDWGDAIDWSLPQDVTFATSGRNADLQAVVDGSGKVWLFWASYDVSTSNWHIVNSRWDGTTWSALETVADGLGGNREPYAILDNAKRIWLFWSRRQGMGTLEDNWTLQQRVFDGTSWSTEVSVTSTPSDGDKRAADRQPGVVHWPNDDLRIFFRSDRTADDTDGLKLWSVTVTPSTGTVTGPPRAITTDYYADHAPSPVLMPDSTLWLLYRSDRSVPLSGVATRLLPTVENRITYPAPGVSTVSAGPLRSIRMPDTGTVRRYTGSISVILTNAARNARRRLWDDLLAYTPQKPQGEALQDDDLYARGTVGLYLSELTPASPLSEQRVERLRPVLERFLPINVRAVVILAPRVAIEQVYPPNADIQESYQDQYPYAEYYSGLRDSAAVALPDWGLLRSNTPGAVSANPANLLTLRHRTYFPPPQ